MVMGAFEDEDAPAGPPDAPTKANGNPAVAASKAVTYLQRGRIFPPGRVDLDWIRRASIPVLGLIDGCTLVVSSPDPLTDPLVS
jgi:hypothetical protein